MKRKQTDIQVINAGSIFLFEPQTDVGTGWLSDNLAEDCGRYGISYVVEHGYAWDIAQGAIADGLVIA